MISRKIVGVRYEKMNADLPQTLPGCAQLHVGSLMVLALLHEMQMVIEDAEASQPFHLAISCRVMVRLVFENCILESHAIESDFDTPSTDQRCNFSLIDLRHGYESISVFRKGNLSLVTNSLCFDM